MRERKFAADAAHELRTPLAGIVTASQLLPPGRPTTHGARRYRPAPPARRPAARAGPPRGRSRRRQGRPGRPPDGRPVGAARLPGRHRRAPVVARINRSQAPREDHREPRRERPALWRTPRDDPRRRGGRSPCRITDPGSSRVDPPRHRALQRGRERAFRGCRSRPGDHRRARRVLHAGSASQTGLAAERSSRSSSWISSRPAGSARREAPAIDRAPPARRDRVGMRPGPWVAWTARLSGRPSSAASRQLGHAGSVSATSSRASPVVAAGRGIVWVSYAGRSAGGVQAWDPLASVWHRPSPTSLPLRASPRLRWPPRRASSGCWEGAAPTPTEAVPDARLPAPR